MSLSALLERVEGATESQWVLLNEAAELLVGETPGDDPFWDHFGPMLDVNAFESAALALIGRVLPGWVVLNCSEWEDDRMRALGPWMAQLRKRGSHLAVPNPASCMHAPTPALALCAALLAAMIGEEAKP